MEDISFRTRRPSSGEAPFGLHELFYSRTDERGVIQSGNDVFQRVAALDWDRLVGAPHRIIRHRDTPRGLFYLMWQRIKQGQPVGVYIKNSTADGLYYWVFATVTPIEDGYLSVRIKPSSPVFDQVRADYAAVHAAEESGFSPEAGAAMLLDRLARRGFDSYEAFMAHAAAKEVAARDAGLGQPRDEALVNMCRIENRLGLIDREIAALLDDLATVYQGPASLRIAAARLEPGGGPITAASHDHCAQAAGILDRLQAVFSDGRSLTATWQKLLHTAIFLHCTARIQDEAVVQCDGVEAAPGKFNPDIEVAWLAIQKLAYREKASKSLAAVIRAGRRLPAIDADLRALVSGLSSVRTTCRAEHARLRGEGDGIAPIADHLDAFLVDADARLNRITRHAEALKAPIVSLDRRQPDAPRWSHFGRPEAVDESRDGRTRTSRR
ncbi:chemotaxis protein [Acidimangrovimonas pyrenivorans]|uniref:Chemotaxis protein n=1 Tax=Acidimangrovimonas pyrenivorans TaxID=2030798 RepID=A0ABV7AKV8_9RHOB